MTQNRKNWSIRNRIRIILTIILVPVSICLLIMSQYTNQKLRTEIVLSNLSILEKQTANLDNRLKQEKNFLSNLFATDTEIYFLRHKSDKENWSNYIYKIRQDFVSSQAAGNIGEIYFLLLEDDIYSTFAYRGDYSSSARISLVSWLSDWDWATAEASIVQNCVSIGEQWYYLIAFRDRKVCIGALISVESIVNLLEIRTEDKEIMTVVNEDGVFMVDESRTEAEEIEYYLPPQKQPYYVTGTGNRRVVIQCASVQMPGQIVYIMDDSTILGNMKPITLFLRALAVGMLLLIPVSLISMRSVLFIPLFRLKETIRKIKEGDMDYKVSCDNVSREMREVYETFNEMTDQIQHFKIRYYEEEIKKKDYQLQYFSLQMKPHFYMNSLKCLYALAQKKEYERLQDMILNLSEYYKHITYDNQSLVALADELEQVSLYMEIRQMGVENKILCSFSMDNRARNIRVPVLCVQTFVENSIKYAMVPGQELKIDIKISLIEQEAYKYLDIMVTDNGTGYKPDIIRAINKEVVDTIDGHVGLTNLWNRLRIIYGDSAFMVISNLPVGGAYSELLLPTEPLGNVGRMNK